MTDRNVIVGFLYVVWILHVITFDDNLDYNPSDVVVIDLSEEVKFIDESCFSS